ncbi:hypothetical protein [Pareuzebyella sediminis]|uniref:hypothetical protein n=1 Tax=Pareuzebyella sediminis TaxID=2607998 RepID=UPI0011EECCAC|nr:hypothetical protein [Pareuzebyella sediminis]
MNSNILINYDTAKPYDSPDASKNNTTKKVADLGSSPETYDQANHHSPTSWLGAPNGLTRWTGYVYFYRIAQSRTFWIGSLIKF